MGMPPRRTFANTFWGTWMSELGQAVVKHGRPTAEPRSPDVAGRRAYAIQTALLGAAYLAAYVLLVLISFVGQNPFANYSWNPNTGASIAVAVMFGRRMIPFFFIAPPLGDLVLQQFQFQL